MHRDQQFAPQCLMRATKVHKANEIMIAEQLDQRDQDKWDEPVEQLISLPLKDEDPLRVVQVRALLPKQERN